MAQTKKFLRGWYRVSGEHHFSNVKLERSGEWSVDLRLGDSGDLVDNGCLCSTKRDAVEEAERMIARKDSLFIARVSA